MGWDSGRRVRVGARWFGALLLAGCAHQAPLPDCPPGAALDVPPGVAAAAECAVEDVPPEIYLRGAPAGMLPLEVTRVRRVRCVGRGTGEPLAAADEIDYRTPIESWASASLEGAGSAVRAGCRVVRVTAEGSGGDSLVVARALFDHARELAGEDALPAEVAALEGTFPGYRVSYEPVTVAGYAPFAPAVVVTLQSPAGLPAYVFVSVRNSGGEAQEAFDRTVVDLSAGARGAAFSLGSGDAAVAMHDRRFGWVNLIRDGRRMCGVVGLPGPDEGWRVLNAVTARLRRTDQR